MTIGLIDADYEHAITQPKRGGAYKITPNLALCKLAAYHKAQGDAVSWYNHFDTFDRVYISKVFTFSPDIDYTINAKEVIRGGSGYRISLQNGREVYDANADKPLPPEVEHIAPDFSIYGITGKTYGFLSRGCPRGCGFCHVAAKEGRRAYKVADLREFWRGEKEIVLFDPNILACSDWRDLLTQLAESGAVVEFNQGLDARLLTEEKAELLARIRMKTVHFAWDNYDDNNRYILNGLRLFAQYKPKMVKANKIVVFVLVNFNTTRAQDLERIYTIRDLGLSPYVMVYDKAHASPYHHQLQRWVNNRYIFASCARFEDYKYYNITT